MSPLAEEEALVVHKVFAPLAWGQISFGLDVYTYMWVYSTISPFLFQFWSFACMAWGKIAERHILQKHLKIRKKNLKFEKKKIKFERIFKLKYSNNSFFARLLSGLKVYEMN